MVCCRRLNVFWSRDTLKPSDIFATACNGLQRPATVENSPASSEKVLATLEKGLGKRFGRRIAALGSDSVRREAVKHVSRRQRGAQTRPRTAPHDARP